MFILLKYIRAFLRFESGNFSIGFFVEDAFPFYYSRTTRGDKVYQCEKCKVKVQAVKQLTVDKVPHVLAIHLKRFNPMGGKINKKVEFGRTLNMKPFVRGQQEGNFNYTLDVILMHAN